MSAIKNNTLSDFEATDCGTACDDCTALPGDAVCAECYIHDGATWEAGA